MPKKDDLFNMNFQKLSVAFGPCVWNEQPKQTSVTFGPCVWNEQPKQKKIPGPTGKFPF